MAFFFLEYFSFRFRDIYVFVSKVMMSVIGDFTKTVQHSIKNISRNIGAVFFKLGNRNIHHKRNRMLLPWQQSWFQSLSEKTQISPFVIFLSRIEGLAQTQCFYSTWTDQVSAMSYPR